MKFLVDNQLPPALARFIEQELGGQAAHVSDLGLREASDPDLWAYASANGWIVVSKDEDFTAMAMRPGPAGLVWVRVGNCRRAVLLELFRRVWHRVVERLENGDRFIEIR